jgi:hypothetical protein
MEESIRSKNEQKIDCSYEITDIKLVYDEQTLFKSRRTNLNLLLYNNK